MLHVDNDPVHAEQADQFGHRRIGERDPYADGRGVLAKFFAKRIPHLSKCHSVQLLK